MKPKLKLLSTTICLFMLAVVSFNALASAPPASDFRAASKWEASHLSSAKSALPFSFAYDHARSVDLLRSWQFTSSTRKLGAAKAERTLIWTDPKTKLSVRCVVVEYQDFPAVEWTVYFKNTGTTPTPILSNIQALDAGFQRERHGEFMLHGTKGDWCAADSFEPFEQTLQPGTTKRFASYGGRPSNAAFPFYNLQKPGGGIFIAIGWPGQWAQFICARREPRPPHQRRPGSHAFVPQTR